MTCQSLHVEDNKRRYTCIFVHTYEEAMKEAIQDAKTEALAYQERANVSISGNKVGAAVVAFMDDLKHWSVFGGCNIELATSRVVHAEFNALMRALCTGVFLNIEVCVVTSSNKDQRAAMCGYCMQDFMYANPECIIIVLEPDGSEKLRTTVRERNGPYAYLGKGKLTH